MAELRSKTGLLNYRDGRVENARFYYGADEDAPANRMQLDPEKHATWIEHDGAVGIRRGAAVSVGASQGYSTNYDNIDWGN
jgi:hypothetical protein